MDSESLARPAQASGQTRAARRTRPQQEALLERLVGIGLALFESGGPEAVTMRRLAGEAGMPPMSLYRYFPTKAHLMRHIWDRVVDDALLRAGAAEQAAGADPAARLRAFLDGLAQYWTDHPDHLWVLFALRAPSASASARAPDDALAAASHGQALNLALRERMALLADHPARTPEQDLLLADQVICELFGHLLGTLGPLVSPSSLHGGLRQRLLDQVLERMAAGLGRHRQPAQMRSSADG